MCRAAVSGWCAAVRPRRGEHESSRVFPGTGKGASLASVVVVHVRGVDNKLHGTLAQTNCSGKVMVWDYLSRACRISMLRSIVADLPLRWSC